MPTGYTAQIIDKVKSITDTTFQEQAIFKAILTTIIEEL